MFEVKSLAYANDLTIVAKTDAAIRPMIARIKEFASWAGLCLEYIDHTYKNRGMESKCRLTGVVTLSLVAILKDLRVLEKNYILKIVTCLAYAFKLFMWEMHNQTVHFFY